MIIMKREENKHLIHISSTPSHIILSINYVSFQLFIIFAKSILIKKKNKKKKKYFFTRRIDLTAHFAEKIRMHDVSIHSSGIVSKC